MGYSYTNMGKLCCDGCEKAGGVRKVRCPFGYCPARALCPDCRKAKAPELTKAAHLAYGCEKSIQESREREARRVELITKGTPVRCAALGADELGVHVLFATDPTNRQCVGYYMDKEVYDAIPLLEVATPDDYRKFGELREAPSEFQWAKAEVVTTSSKP